MSRQAVAAGTSALPWLTAALGTGSAPAPPPPAAPAGGPVAAAFAAATRRHAGAVPAGPDAAWAAAARDGAALLARLAPAAHAAAEHGLRWAALWGLHRRLLEGEAGAWWGGAAPAILVHPDDAARLRLLLLTRGAAPAPPLIAGIAPPGFTTLPMTPFLEGAQASEPLPRLASDGAWAVHRLLAVRGLLLPELTRPMELVLAALDEDPDPATAAAWDERAARWGVHRLWRRSAEVVAWLRGGPRPVDLAGPNGTGPVPGRAAWLRAGLRLQDSPGRALRFVGAVVTGARGGPP